VCGQFVGYARGSSIVQLARGDGDVVSIGTKRVYDVQYR
jgi:hypothetical protein